MGCHTTRKLVLKIILHTQLKSKLPQVSCICSTDTLFMLLLKEKHKCIPEVIGDKIDNRVKEIQIQEKEFMRHSLGCILQKMYRRLSN